MLTSGMQLRLQTGVSCETSSPKKSKIIAQPGVGDTSQPRGGKLPEYL
jgi:hypothetical protein